jgi:hypothetical protein
VGSDQPLRLARLRIVDLRKHIFDANQLVVEYLFRDIKQPKDRAISDRIVNVQAFLTTSHDIATTQNRELLRQSALLNSQKTTQLSHAKFPIAKCVQHGYAERMSQGFEEFRFEASEFTHVPMP